MPGERKDINEGYSPSRRDHGYQPSDGGKGNESGGYKPTESTGDNPTKDNDPPGAE